MAEELRLTGDSLRMKLHILFIAIILNNCAMASQGFLKTPSMFEINQSIMKLPLSLRQIEEPPWLRFELLLAKMKTVTEYKEMVARHNRFNEQANYINNQYKKLNLYKTSNKAEDIRITELLDFANRSTSDGYHNMSNHLEKFVNTILPSAHHYRGLFRYYSKFMRNMDQENKWCGQSINYFIYNAFRYTLNIIRKGYSIILQSYAIRNTFDEAKNAVNSDLHIDSLPRQYGQKHFKAEYEFIAKRIAKHFERLVNGASTRVAPCPPLKQIRNETYLEMEKFLQGILPPKVTLNREHSAYGDCEDHKTQGTPYYPYEGVRHDGDWKCHGLMYDCFGISSAIDVCQASTANRRFDGWMEYTCQAYGCLRSSPDHGMGKHCPWFRAWSTEHWRYSLPRMLFESKQCACVCDDTEHPMTLRKFSREYTMSDYKNNMVVTGIRLVSISNVVHIQIQEGKLEEFGFSNPSTVHWREKNDLVTYDDGGDEVVTLSYHKRRVNLDVFHYTPNDAIIGAAFDWDNEKKGVQLSVFATVFSFSTGELNGEYRKRLPPHGPREEIILGKPHLPTRCRKNVPIRGDNKFIKFQTSDWKTDAAQATIPYLDIKPVVTSPPTMLRGVGLYYKGDSRCGGYIGLELYSHQYENLIFHNHTLH